MSLDMGAEFFPTDILLEEDRKITVAETISREFGLSIGGLPDLIVALQESLTGKAHKEVLEAHNKNLAERFSHVSDLTWIAASIGKILGSWDDTNPLGSESLSAVEAKAKFVALLSAIQEMVINE